MLRKASEAVPEGNGPVPQKEEFGSGQLTWGDVYRIIKVAFDRWDKKLDEISDEMRKMDEHATRLEHRARQPRLAMEADDESTNTKTRERTEGAAIVVQAKRGDSYTAKQKVQDGPKTSISFGMMAEPPALPCRDDVLVESGFAASESCLPSLEMRSSTAAGGLVPTGKASTAKETNFNQPPLRFCSTEKTDLEPNCKKTLTSSGSYDSSSFWRMSATPYCRRVVDTNPGKIELLTQAVHEVTSAPAHFWDRGARWFVTRLYGLRQLVTSCSVFSEEIRWLSCNKAGFDAVPEKSLAVEGGSRLHEQEGGTEVTTSWRLEVIGSQGRTVVEERHGAMSVLEPIA